MQGKKAYWLTKRPISMVTTDSLNTTGGKWYGGWVNDVRTYQKVKVETKDYKLKAAPGGKMNFDLNIINPYPFAINFSNTGYEHRVAFEACLFKDGYIIHVQEAGNDFNQMTLKQGESKHYNFNFVAPEEKGKYTLMFSLRTGPFLGSKNSRIISLTIE
jgi:hypothetical protein